MHRRFPVDTVEKQYLSLGLSSKFCAKAIVSVKVCIIRYIFVIHCSHLFMLRWCGIKVSVFIWPSPDTGICHIFTRMHCRPSSLSGTDHTGLGSVSVSVLKGLSFFLCKSLKHHIKEGKTEPLVLVFCPCAWGNIIVLLQTVFCSVVASG